MNESSNLETLNELLQTLGRSLAAYLAQARPWTPCQGEKLCEAVTRLAADQKRYIARLEQAIVELGGRPDPGRFPAEFAAKNDLSLEYLRQELLRRQEEDIAAIKQCAEQLEGDASLHSLAEEILGNAKGHRDILKEMMNDEIQMTKE